MIVTNIQRFSLHDGPGIRTTVFLKGCSLCCPWCSNPENISFEMESYVKNGKAGIYGREYSNDEIFAEVMKDREFYKEGGGVTFSGGEALLRSKELVLLLERFKREGIGTAVETCLFVPLENILSVVDLVDYFYVDMKIMDESECENVLKRNLSLYLSNLDELIRRKKVVIRIPLIKGYTDSEDNRRRVIEEICKRQEGIVRIELIKGHNLGDSKYVSLGYDKPGSFSVSDDFMTNYKRELEAKLKVPVEICSI